MVDKAGGGRRGRSVVLLQLSVRPLHRITICDLALADVMLPSEMSDHAEPRFELELALWEVAGQPFSLKLCLIFLCVRWELW